MKYSTILLTSILLMGCTERSGQQRPQTIADTVLTNGNVVTIDESRPFASAVAIIGDRITAVGSNEEIAAFVGDATEVIDLQGKTAIPGFIEGHGHFTGVGQQEQMPAIDNNHSRVRDFLG